MQGSKGCGAKQREGQRTGIGSVCSLSRDQLLSAGDGEHSSPVLSAPNPAPAACSLGLNVMMYVYIILQVFFGFGIPKLLLLFSEGRLPSC